MTQVTELLARREVQFEVLPHEEAHSSIEEALSLGVYPHEVIKSIVAITSRGPVLLVIPGSRKLDMKLVRGAVHDHHARLATEEEISRMLPEFELGAIPPIPSLVGLPTYVDTEILAFETIIVPAGVSTLSVKGRRDDLIGDEPISRIVPLTQRPEVAA